MIAAPVANPTAMAVTNLGRETAGKLTSTAKATRASVVITGTLIPSHCKNKG